MTHISRADAEILATFVRRLRPPAGHEGHWNQAGTIAAIQACKAPLSETAIALIRMAEDMSVRTPALLNSDGHWWFRAARGEQATGPALRPSVTCPEHKTQPIGACEECAKAAGPELTPRQIADRAAECRRLAKERMDRAEQERRDLAARQEAGA